MLLLACDDNRKSRTSHVSLPQKLRFRSKTQTAFATMFAGQDGKKAFTRGDAMGCRLMILIHTSVWGSEPIRSGVEKTCLVATSSHWKQSEILRSDFFPGRRKLAEKIWSHSLVLPWKLALPAKKGKQTKPDCRVVLG